MARGGPRRFGGPSPRVGSERLERAILVEITLDLAGLDPDEPEPVVRLLDAREREEIRPADVLDERAELGVGIEVLFRRRRGIAVEVVPKVPYRDRPFSTYERVEKRLDVLAGIVVWMGWVEQTVGLEQKGEQYVAIWAEWTAAREEDDSGADERMEGMESVYR